MVVRANCEFYDGIVVIIVVIIVVVVNSVVVFLRTAFSTRAFRFSLLVELIPLPPRRNQRNHDTPNAEGRRRAVHAAK